MNNRNWFILKQICCFISCLELGTVLSIDESYETCLLPVNCGRGPDISFPFWVDGEQNSSCGSPGFGISCKDSQPIITLSGDEYIIRDIVYKEQSLHITKNRLSNEICSPLAYRVEFNQFLFNFVPNSVNLSLFFNCTALLPSEYLNYSFGCSADTPGNRYLALLGNDSKLEYVNQSGQCANHEVIHVDVFGNGDLDALAPKDFIDGFLEAGFHLKWNAVKCDECLESGGRCGFNFTSNKFMCFCRDRPYQRSCDGPTIEMQGSNKGKKLAMGMVAGIGSIFLTCSFFIYWKRKEMLTLTYWKRDKKGHKAMEMFLKNYGSLAPRRYHYTEIKRITNSFKNQIGKGGYGKVYKGKLPDGRLVAVKLLNEAKGDGDEFINEVASIGRTNHVNVVSLLGFCFDGKKRALIYEFMANGSLEKFIYDHSLSEAQSRLGWETLYQIAVGVGRGLEYLHRGCNTRILHFDIKPHNILLDKDFTPKISDFGLAKLCPRKESNISMLDTRGTVGYIAPELVSRIFGRVSHKSDVYSYGMMILEMVGRRKNVDVGVEHTSEIYFPHWIYKRLVLDQDMGLRGVTSDTETEVTRKMILVALWCIQANPIDRPAMSRVVEMLEGKQEQLSIPPKPYLCSLPGSPCVSPI